MERDGEKWREVERDRGETNECKRIMNLVLHVDP